MARAGERTSASVAGGGAGASPSSQQQQGLFNTRQADLRPDRHHRRRRHGRRRRGAGHGRLREGDAGPRRARASPAAGAARGRRHRAAGGGRQAVERGQGALRPRGGDRSAARARQGEHPLLHAGDLAPGAARSALLPAVRHRRADRHAEPTTDVDGDRRRRPTAAVERRGDRLRGNDDA